MNLNVLRMLAVAVALFMACAAGPVRAEWRKAETAHFIVYGDTSERDIRAFARRIERFDSFLRTYYPIETEYLTPKLEIYLAAGARDMNRVYPGIGPSVGGFYSSNSGRIYAVVNTTVMTGDVVLFHEYAHHFMFQMRGGDAYPSWFVEGFAEYYATADMRSERVQFGRHHPGRMLVLNYTGNSSTGMDDVLEWRYSASGRYPASIYYAQAWGLTHYLMSTPERQRILSQYLGAVVRGENSITAMQAATGRTPAQLQSDVRRYLAGPIQILTPQIDLPEPEVTVLTLTPAENAMVWLDIRLDNTDVIELPEEEDGQTRKSESQKAREARERAEVRADLIRDAHAAAARFPGDRMALLTAARAYRLELKPAEALETLKPLIGDQSTDADALRVAAMALLDQVGRETDPQAGIALRRQASGYLARSMDVAPLDFRTYLGLNEVRRGLDTYPTDNDLATLQAAVAMAPQAFEGRMRLGEALMMRGAYAEAISFLQPVSNSPHRSIYTRRAREMIAAARQAMGQAVENRQTLSEEAASEPLAEAEASGS